MVDVRSVKVLDGYQVRLRFRDGLEKTVDLRSRLKGRLFGPLKDPVRFRQVRVDPDAGTIVWPNGADICPDLLYYGGPPLWARQWLKKRRKKPAAP